MSIMQKYILLRGVFDAENESGAVEAAPQESDSGGSETVEQEAPAPDSDGAEQAQATPEAPKPSGQPWYTKRIDTLTRQLHETRRAAEEAEARLRAQTESQEQPQGQGQGYTPDDIERRAAELADMRAFNQRSNAVYQQGLAEYPDFQQNLTQLQQVAGGQLPMMFLQNVLELDASAQVLNEIAKDPNLAYDLMFEQNASRMALKLARFEAKLTSAPPPPKPSSAPPPVSSRARAAPTPAARTVYDPDIDIAEFMRMRSGK